MTGTISRKIFLLLALKAALLGQQTTEKWHEIPIKFYTHTEQKFSEIPPGWQSVDDEDGPCKDNVKNRLVDASVYSGKPNRCARLIPDETHDNKSKDIYISIWKIDFPVKDGYWIRLDYTYTRLSLALQLPSTAKEVRVTSKKHTIETKIEYR